MSAGATYKVEVELEGGWKIKLSQEGDGVAMQCGNECSGVILTDTDAALLVAAMESLFGGPLSSGQDA